MPKHRPVCYIIAGPNGAGKTTFAREFLPNEARCLEFVNPDLIAAGLSPFDPTRAAPQAAKLVLQRIRELARSHADFAMESTLAGKTYLSLFREMKKNGYMLHMFYLWVSDPALAILRIKDRVNHGGHDVPEDAVLRRFPRSLANLKNLYGPIMDSLVFYNNSGKVPSPIFTVSRGRRTILQKSIYLKIMEGMMT